MLIANIYIPKNLSNTLILLFLIVILFFSSCKNSSAPSQVAENEPLAIAKSAPEWDALFKNEKGWFGGDGIFAIPLDGKEFIPATDSTRTLFIFSDSVIGELDAEGKVKSKDQYTFIHNVTAILKGNQPIKDSFEFVWATDESGKPTSMFAPNTPSTKPGEYYWLGDGFVNVDVDSTLYIFAYRIEDLDPAEGFFTFRQVSVSLLAIPAGEQPPFKNVRQLETPLLFPYKGNPAHMTTFGNGVMVNTASAGAPDPDGYIYVMGSSPPNIDMLLARTLPQDFENLEKWTFWNGKEWVADYNQVTGVISSVSNEMSMSPLAKDRYIAAFQLFGMTNEVAVQIGKSPTGPFFPHRKVWNCPEAEQDIDYFAYNAKGYPHLSKPGELLISYNVNSFDFFVDLVDDPTHCRPRFISVKVH